MECPKERSAGTKLGLSPPCAELVWDPPRGLPPGHFRWAAGRMWGQPKFVSTQLCFVPAWWGPCNPGLNPHPAQHDNPRKNVSRRQELLGTGETFQGHSCKKSLSSVLPKDWRPSLPPTDRLARKRQCPVRPWLGGRRAPLRQAVEPGARRTGKAASYPGQLLSPKNHCPLSSGHKMSLPG